MQVLSTYLDMHFPDLFFSSRMCVHASQVALVVSNSLQSHQLLPTSLLCPWDSSGRNTAMGCHALIQGFFLTQGSNPPLLHFCIGRKILYH